MCKLRKPIFLIVEIHTGVAYCRETELEKAFEIMNRLNAAEGYHYCIQKCYN